jgi:hypothetical protein
MTGNALWRQGSVCLLGALALAALFGGWRLLNGQRGNTARVTAAPQGEPLTNSPLAPAEDMTDAAAKKRHPQPPSVQRRMVMAQLALSQSGGLDNASLGSGTAGTAAEWVKANGSQTTNIAAGDARIPGYLSLSFNTLSGFAFPVLNDLSPNAAALIPQDIRALDGKKAAIEGFLLPVRMKEGLAVEFLLMRNQSMCCYGVPPRINEWITVQTAQGVKPVMDQPILAAGTLHVGEILDSGGLAGIYRMDADKIIEP